MRHDHVRPGSDYEVRCGKEIVVMTIIQEVSTRTYFGPNRPARRYRRWLARDKANGQEAQIVSDTAILREVSIYLVSE